MPPPPVSVARRPLFFVGDPVADVLRWFWKAAAPQDKRWILSSAEDAATLPNILAALDDKDQSAYFQEIQDIQQARHVFEQALQDSGAPVSARDTESSYRIEVVRQAKRVLMAVNANTEAEFQTLGESEQVLTVEKRLRALLIDALQQAIVLDLEALMRAEMILAINAAVMQQVRESQGGGLERDEASETEIAVYDADPLPSPSTSVPTESVSPVEVVALDALDDPETEVRLSAGEVDIPSLKMLSPHALLLRLQDYLLTNKALLVSGSQVHIHAVSQMILLHQPAANSTQAYIAWRCMDSEVETIDWPMLTVAPHPLKSKNTCFSTADTYEGGRLILEEASRLIRLQLAKCVLACTDSALPLELRAELATQVVFYLAEIHRSHNDTIVSQDSPSCYPGTFTRLAQMLRLHPAYKDLFPPPDDRMIIAEAFFAKLSRIFFDRCASLETLDEKSAYFDALAGYLHSEHIPVLADSYLTFADALVLPQWRECRLALRLAIREGETESIFITEFLQSLKTLGRIKEISAVSESWLRYLLVSLVDSRETLAKLWYKLEELFVKADELDAAVAQGSALLPQYEQQTTYKRKHSESDDDTPAHEDRPVFRRRTRSPSPTAESLLELL